MIEPDASDIDVLGDKPVELGSEAPSTGRAGDEAASGTDVAVAGN